VLNTITDLNLSSKFDTIEDCRTLLGYTKLPYSIFGKEAIIYNDLDQPIYRIYGTSV